jgi:hypothetical protein
MFRGPDCESVLLFSFNLTEGVEENNGNPYSEISIVRNFVQSNIWERRLQEFYE